MTSTFLRSTIVLGVAVMAAACGKDSTAPVKPASVSAASSGFTGTVGAALTTPPTFSVLDASGNAMANVSVTVVVVSGGGTLTGAPTKSAAGQTSVGTWILGSAAGPNALAVTVNGLPALTIVATGTPDVPTQITAVGGAALSAVAGGTLTAPVSFKVGDRFNNGVPNVVVTFAIAAGGGTISGPATATSDAAGLVTAGAWTLGKSTAAQQLRATAGALAAATSATVTSNYAVEVRYFGPAVDATIQAAFTAAAHRIQGMVTGDLANVNLTVTNTLDLAPCGITGTPPLGEPIDDIFIYANVATIDGPGMILGSASPCYVRTVGGLTLVGKMNFDVADMPGLITTNRLNDVILHEMLHVVGVGSLWASKGQLSGAGTASSAFIGLQAVLGCTAHGGTAANQCGNGTVPVQTTGGVGTVDLHWRETTTATGIGFRTELMTGFISAAGTANPLSQITIGSLADLGYVVNLLAADAYTVPSTLAAALGTIREAQGMGDLLIGEAVHPPVGSVDAAGRLTIFQGKP